MATGHLHFARGRCVASQRKHNYPSLKDLKILTPILNLELFTVFELPTNHNFEVHLPKRVFRTHFWNLPLTISLIRCYKQTSLDSGNFTLVFLHCFFMFFCSFAGSCGLFQRPQSLQGVVVHQRGFSTCCSPFWDVLLCYGSSMGSNLSGDVSAVAQVLLGLQFL